MAQLIPLETQGARGRARAFLTLGVGTMMAAGLSVWVALLATATETAILLPGPAQEVIVLAAALVARWLLVGPRGERTVRALFTTGGLLAAAIAVWVRFSWWRLPVGLRLPVEPVVVAALIALALWWIGGRIGASPLDDYAAFRFFGVGVAGLFGGLIADALAGGRGVAALVLGAATVTFFVAAFLTLPAAQLVSVRERGRGRGSPLPPLDRRWAGAAGAATFAIVALALILSATSSGALLTMAADLLGRIPDLLATILSPFIVAAGYLVQALVDLIHHIMGASNGATRPAPPTKLPRPLHSGQHHAAPPIAHVILGAMVAIVVAAIVLALLSRAIGRLSALRHDQAFEEERDSVWSWEEAGAGWQSVLGRLRGRLRRARRAEHAPTGGPPRSTREAYRRLLRRGAALGHARAAPETPQEYLGRLRSVPIPDERDATVLTAAYMRVRYGEEQERPEDVEQAARSWERLDRALRRPATGGQGLAADGVGRSRRRAGHG